MKWSELAPKPRARPAPAGPFDEPPIRWDAFLSYRSTNRNWAAALYDQLVETGSKVFLDQFVLRPGLDLDQALAENLDRSGSGVLVLSKDVASSDWVRHELARMRELHAARANSELPFNYVIARIDDAQLPLPDGSAMYADFSSGYEDGPRGAELVRLIYGLVGRPIPDDTVRILMKMDTAMSDQLLQIAAYADQRRWNDIVQLVRNDPGMTTDLPMLTIRAAQALISGAAGPTAKESLEAALELLGHARAQFPRSLRLLQLTGLALRRLGRTADAQNELAKLYVAGHRDPETMGIYAATWMARYRVSNDRADLERSRALYLDAFKLSPRDEYVGINAASKSAFLGELGVARELAEKVGKLVSKFVDCSDFYKSLSLAEALVLLGRYDEAEKLYRDVRVRYPERGGDLVTTREQFNALALALAIPEDIVARIRLALGVP